MTAPAPLHTLLEKLHSPTPEVRIVALIHARAHAGAARSLAVEIARMFEDESPAVQWHAMGAFMKVGHGAGDAVPVLVAQLEKGTPPMLVSRALAALEVIGQPAASARPAVMTMWEASTDESRRADALKALASIAPGDEGVRQLLLVALYAPEYTTSSRARSALEHAPADLVDYVVRKVRERGVGGSPAERLAAANILATLAPHQPEFVTGLIPSFLERIGEPCITAALHAVSELPGSRPIEHLSAIIRIAREGGLTESERAIGLLEGICAAAARALPVFVQRINEHAEAPPLGGPAGQAARVFAAAAKAVAATSLPAPGDVVAKVTQWLHGIPAMTWPEKGGPSWYTIRDVGLAAAKMSPGSAAVAQALIEVAEESRKWLDADESGVMDFEASLNQAVYVLGDPPDVWSSLEKLGIQRQPADGSEAEDEEGAPDLPDFPPEAPPPKRRELRAVPLPADIWRALADALPRGETLAGVTAGASPSDVAKAVDAAIRRAHRARSALTEDEVIALGALWGKALADGAGWSWAQVEDGDQKYVCLVPKDHAHACPVFTFTARQAKANSETTVLLLFNMILAGKWPEAKAGQLSFVT